MLPLLTNEGKAHHGDILHHATRLAEAGSLKPLVDAHRFDLGTVGDAHVLVEGRRA